VTGAKRVDAEVAAPRAGRGNTDFLQAARPSSEVVGGAAFSAGGRYGKYLPVGASLGLGLGILVARGGELGSTVAKVGRLINPLIILVTIL
jgi:hypothetical protein